MAMLTEIKRLRLDQKFPQEVVARRAGVSQASLSGYERGLRPVPQKVAVRLAKALGVSIRKLFATEEAP